jgi:hypothetical protein
MVDIFGRDGAAALAAVVNARVSTLPRDAMILFADPSLSAPE